MFEGGPKGGGTVGEEVGWGGGVAITGCLGEVVMFLDFRKSGLKQKRVVVVRKSRFAARTRDFL